MKQKIKKNKRRKTRKTIKIKNVVVRKAPKLWHCYYLWTDNSIETIFGCKDKNEALHIAEHLAKATKVKVVVKN